MNIPCRICVYCLLLFGYEGYSQSSSLYFHHLDKNSGIPQSVCNDIYRDSRGFVWITTISGLYRFDGTQFIDVLKEDETLKSHALRDIAEDKNGSLWLTKNDDELVNFNPYRGTAEIISLRSFLQPQNISVIGLNLLHVDEYNRLWIGINGKGIACFDIKTRLLKIILMPVAGIDVITFFFSKENLFKSVLFKKTPGSDLVYQGTFDAELNIKWVFKQNPEMHGSEFIYASDTCNVWYAEKNNLVQYNWQTNTISRYYFLSKTPQDLLQGMMFLDNKRKRLWISFKHGITCFDIAQKKITQRYEHDPSDPYSIKEGSLPVLCDDEENLWLTRFGDGISFCNLSSFRLQHLLNKKVAEKNGISNFIRALTTDHLGNIYLSAEGTGIVVLDSSGNFRQVLLKEQGSSFEALYRDRAGKIWIGGQDNYVYNPYKKQIEIQLNKSDFERHRVSIFLQLKDGNFLAGTYTNLFLYRPAARSAEVLEGIRDKNQIFSFLYELPNGDLLVGQRDRGLKRYRPAANGYTLLQEIHHNLFVKSCLSINEDSLWLATTVGLYTYKISTGALLPLTAVNQKLPNLYLYAVLKDVNGYYWVSSNTGLFRWKGNHYKSFGSTEGVQSAEFNTNAFCQSDNGTLYVGGVNGINKIDQLTPDSFYNYGTRLQLLRVMASDTSFLHPDEQGQYRQIKLSPGNSIIEIEYNCINFFQPGKYKVQYRLRNYNDSWQTAATIGTARFVNIKPGAYFFEIRLYNPDNLQPGMIHTLPVYLVPYWWQTTVFKVSAAAFLLAAMAGLSVFFFRYRIRRERIQLEQQLAIQKERERIVSDLHDDIGASLSSMSIYSELAGTVIESKPEESKALVDKISGTAKELMSRMGDIIWSMKPADEEKYTLEARLKNYSSELLAPKNIVCEFYIDDKLAVSITNPDVRRNLLLIAKEAINNIAKYSEATKAVVNLQLINNRAVFSITDNGKGFILEENQQGNGLQHLRQRTEYLKGRYNIVTSPGKGTTVNCIFPLATFSHKA